MTQHTLPMETSVAENNQKNYKKDNFYIFSIEIVFFTYLEPFCPSLKKPPTI
ncbi:MAG: hypothetical protein E7K95_03975 [Staphylococcus epidermidis]|nr:hypothetical protein [Staphylococcus epidermidis]